LPGIGVVDGTATKSTTLTFSQPGTYVFTCTIHPGMEGRVVVKG
jgi:plastocyanin